MLVVENSLYFLLFLILQNTHGNGKLTFHTFITLQHTTPLLHVDSGNGKLTLLSTFALSNNTNHYLFMLILETENSLLFSTLSSSHLHTHTHTHTHTLLVDVDPENGKLTSLSTLDHLTPLYLFMLTQETENSFYFSNVHRLSTPYTILVHVDCGNGKLTLFSTLSSSHLHTLLVHVDPENGKLASLSTLDHLTPLYLFM